MARKHFTSSSTPVDGCVHSVHHLLCHRFDICPIVSDNGGRDGVCQEINKDFFDRVCIVYRSVNLHNTRVIEEDLSEANGWCLEPLESLHKHP